MPAPRDHYNPPASFRPDPGEPDPEYHPPTPRTPSVDSLATETGLDLSSAPVLPFRAPPFAPPTPVEIPTQPSHIRIISSDDSQPLKDIISKYEEIHAKLDRSHEVSAWPPNEACEILSEAATDIHAVSERLYSLTAKFEEYTLSDASTTLENLTQQVTGLERHIQSLQEDRTESTPVQRTALDQVAGSLVRITICTLFAGLIAGPILTVLAATPFSPWVAKMVDVTFGSLFASVATEISTAATRRIDS